VSKAITYANGCFVNCIFQAVDSYDLVVRGVGQPSSVATEVVVSVSIGAKTEHPLQFLKPLLDKSWEYVALWAGAPEGTESHEAGYIKVTTIPRLFLCYIACH
jgi:hypothetical protein